MIVRFASLVALLYALGFILFTPLLQNATNFPTLSVLRFATP